MKTCPTCGRPWNNLPAVALLAILFGCLAAIEALKVSP